MLCRCQRIEIGPLGSHLGGPGAEGSLIYMIVKDNKPTRPLVIAFTEGFVKEKEYNEAV